MSAPVRTPSPPTGTASVRGAPRLAGCGSLARMALRRDRVRLIVWALLTLGILVSLVSSVVRNQQTLAQRQEYAAHIGDSAAAAAFSGPLYGLTTKGGIAVAEALTIIMFGMALGSLLLIVRYTRTDEETGRAELIASTGVSRYGRLAAAVVVVGGADLVLGAVSTLIMLAFGLPAPGCVAFGLVLTLVGWTFAGVGALFAQVFQHSRTAMGTSVAVFGAALVLRAIGDAGLIADGRSPLRYLSWASPLGWAFEVRPYAGERWWVAALMFALAVVLVGAAAALVVRRDIDAGLIPARLGRARATPRFGSAWGLAWRLQRGGIAGWGVGIALFAGVFGSFAVEMDDMARSGGSVDLLARLGGSRVPSDSWIAWTLSLAGMVSAIYVVSAVLRLRAEEDGLRTEMVLATAVGRRKWCAAHLVTAAVGVTVIMVASGLVAGLVHGLRADDLGGQLPRVLGGALVQVPAALLMAAVAFAVHAFLPRLTALAWVAVVGAVLLTQIGASLRFDQAVLDISPFTHAPKAPAAPVHAAPLLWFLGSAVLLAAAGLYRVGRRDIGVS
ncbi:exporter of polyketide antibiotics [Actinoallomurus oryzae]|uniref:Exporter of polyketide antibiotics n=1 Tax=Actinoallomurus oryzae TaxID=502180 RepID=A0ABP8P5A2_9ACTN